MKDHNHLIKTCPWQRILSGVLLFSLVGWSARAGTGHRTKTAPLVGLLYVVDSGGDEPDIFQGDGQCRTEVGTCTLRAAIQETNASNTGQDGIVINVPLVSLTQALPDLITPIEISGSGPDQTIVERSQDPGIPEFRIFNVSVPSPGTVSLSSMTIQYGLFSTGIDSTKDGAGIQNLNTGTLTLANCKVSQNSTVDRFCACGSSVGGGIANTGTGTVNVIGSTVNANGADFGGGGIANSSTGVVNITSSSVLENGADLGGGLFNPDIGTMNVTDSSIENNNICDFCAGNGIYNGAGNTNVTNSTVSQNGVVLNGDESAGGGIYNDGGFVSVSNSTLSMNVAASGAGIYNAAGELFLSNSTCSGDVRDGFAITHEIFNQSGAEMFVLSTIFDDQDRPEGFFVSLGYNLVSNADNAQGFTASTDQIGTFVSPLEPMLDPNGLQDNGGPTSTIALLPGSPAVDKGTSNGLTTDQRGTGFPRAFDDPSILNAIAGDGTDVGAYELQTAVPTPTPTPTLTPTPTPTPTPAPPVAKRAANVTAKSFVANWSVVVGVKGYRLDVSTDDSFKTYLAGYQDLNVGNVTGWSVTGLSPLTDYYYRVRAYDATSTSPNSNVIKVKTKLK